MDLLDDDHLLDIRRRAKRTDPGAVVDELNRHVEDVPERNSALSDWAANLGAPGPEPEAGKCHVCGRNGHQNCNQCGRLACSADYWVMYGLCRACAKDERVRSVHRSPQAEDTNWLKGDP